MIYMNSKTLKALLCAFVLLAAAVLGGCSTGSAQSVAPLIDFIGSDKSLAAGDYVTFGHYEQDNDLSNGAEPIEWRVVSVQKEMGKVVLLSRYGLDARPYHSEELTAMHTDSSVSWDMCDLRAWLNGDFLNAAFSAEERGRLLCTLIENPSSDYSGTSFSRGGEDTRDTVFLPDFTEAADRHTFSSSEARMCAPTDYAIAQGAATSPNDKVDGRAAGSWWLRSPGLDDNEGMCITPDGSSTYVQSTSLYMVRPVVFVDIRTDEQRAVIEAGDHVTFGTYPQTTEGNDQTPIEWVVLSIRDDQALLLSRYCLDAQPMHHDWGFFTHWKDCDLRIWLNDEFYNTAFSPEDQSAIIPLFVDSNSGSYCPEEYSGEYTDDLVSIFTINNAKAYRTGRILDLATSNTAYAEAQGAPSYQGNAEWWLCTHESYGACHLFKFDNSIQSDFLTEIKGVRPIILVKPEVLTKISFQ